MPSTHKHPPIAYRPPADVRDRLFARRDEEGEPLNATITRALREFFAGKDRTFTVPPSPTGR